MGQPQQLITLGPFKAIDVTSAGPYVAPNVGVQGTGSNPHRVPLALVAERGRNNLATINGSSIGAITPYIPSPNDEQIYGVKNNPVTPQRFVYDIRNQSETDLVFGGKFDRTEFDQAVQVGNVMYDNAGHQYSALNPTHTYTWQYDPFSATPVDINGITVSASSTPVPSGSVNNFYGVTLDFTFTRLVFGPNSAYAQESSAPSLAQGVNVPEFPAQISYTFPVSGAIYYPQIVGTFVGTNDDGTTWFTNGYVQSNVLPVWYFFATLGNTGYHSPYVVKMNSTQDFIANAQLIPTRDAPPVSSDNEGALAYHKGSVWALVVNSAFISPNQNATGTPQGVNLQQMQLWWSKYGIPWEFDSANQVGIIDSDVPPGVPPYSGTYGERPIALVSLASILLAWTTHQTIVVYGDGTSNSPYVLRKIFDMGTRARNSFAVCVLDQAGPVVCWLSENGVQMTDGQYAYRIDEPIREFINNLSMSDRENAVGFYARHAYYLSFPDAGVTWGFYMPTGDWFGPLPYTTTAAYYIPANPATSLSYYGLVNEVTAVRPGTAEIDQWFTGGDLDLGQSQTVTWVSPLTPCGDPRRQKSFDYISVNAPVQPGVFATVTVTTEVGSVSKTFDLGKGPSTVTTMSDPDDTGPFLGYLGQVSVTMNTVSNIGMPAQIWAVAVDGTMLDMVPFDTGAVT